MVHKSYPYRCPFDAFHGNDFVVGFVVAVADGDDGFDFDSNLRIPQTTVDLFHQLLHIIALAVRSIEIVAAAVVAVVGVVIVAAAGYSN